jgi:hypothetical protein
MVFETVEFDVLSDSHGSLVACQKAWLDQHDPTPQTHQSLGQVELFWSLHTEMESYHAANGTLAR